MRKLLTILMIALIATFAFAGGWRNIYAGTAFEDSDLDTYFRFVMWDETGEDGGYLEYGELKLALATVNEALYTQQATLSVDTNTVVADQGLATQTITLTAGQLLQVLGLYPGGTWDTTDFIEFNNADSNATTLDTMRLGIQNVWDVEGAFDFYATQDTIIYINLGDTVSVAPTVIGKVKYEIK